MEYRLLGRSGLKVSALTLGTMTFGGEGFFAKAGNSSVAEARRIIDISRDAGINLLDTANVYSTGKSEEMVGEVFRASYRRLVTQLYAVTGDRVEAEDAVQEAFARAVASGERWRDVLNPEVAANYLVEQFAAERTSVVDVQRGMFLNASAPIVNKASVAVS